MAASTARTAVQRIAKDTAGEPAPALCVADDVLTLMQLCPWHDGRYTLAHAILQALVMRWVAAFVLDSGRLIEIFVGVLGLLLGRPSS